MRMTYDEQADAAYIYVSDVGLAAVQFETCGPWVEGGAAIILAYDHASHLIGLAILGASRLLTRDALNGAERLEGGNPS